MLETHFVSKSIVSSHTCQKATCLNLFFTVDTDGRKEGEEGKEKEEEEEEE